LVEIATPYIAKMVGGAVTWSLVRWLVGWGKN